MTTLSIIGGTLEKMAVEIRGLQKTEFNEVLEPFSKKQKGSSAMPHKKIPLFVNESLGYRECFEVCLNGNGKPSLMA